MATGRRTPHTRHPLFLQFVYQLVRQGAIDLISPAARRIPFLSVGAVAVTALLLLAGCSRDATPTTGGGPNAGPTGAGGAAATRPAAPGGGNAARGGGRGGRPNTVMAFRIAPSTLRDETEALGTAKANEAVDITAKATNRVVALHLREGGFVKQGDVLVEFDATEARANLAAAEATARDTQSQYQRGKQLFQNKALSESDMVQVEAKMLNSRSGVEAAQARVNDTVIRAPFGGRIGLRNTSVGSLVTPGQVITTLDDIDVIKLDFSVPEAFLSVIREGESLEAATSAYAGEVFRGKVDSIATRVDPVSRSIVVRALIDNRNHRLKPGMFMTVRLQRSSTQALMVPEQALMPQGESQFVYVLYGDTARKTQVKLGRRRPGQVEVLSGLHAGDLLIIEGGDELQDGAKVQATVTEKAPEGSLLGDG
jgi:membrane fusion protein (multidrug efflux system)